MLFAYLLARVRSETSIAACQYGGRGGSTIPSMISQRGCTDHGDGARCTPHSRRQNPSDVAHALCGLQRPRREDVVSRKGGSTKATGHGVDACGSSFRQIEFRLMPWSTTALFHLGSGLSHTAVSHGACGGQFATIPPPRPLFPDDRSHLRCRPRRYCPAGGRALPPQRRFRELQSVPRARLHGGWRPWLVRNIGMRGVHTAIGCDSEMQIMKDGVTTRNLCRRISPPNDDAPEPLPRTRQPCHSNG